MTQNDRRLYLTFHWVIALLIYYLCIFSFGIALSVFAIIPELFVLKSPNVFHLAVAGSIGMSCSGSSIFYTRKLYKTCFLLEPNDLTGSDDRLKRLGTAIYFIGRPLFSVGFSLLVIVALRAGFILTSKSELELDDGFVYLSMFLSFWLCLR